MNSLSHSANRGRSDYFRKWRRINTVMTLALGLSATGACTSAGTVTNERVTQGVTRGEATVQEGSRNIGPARLSAIASTETLRKEIERNAIAPTFAEPRIKL